jgi:hypothetical protein
MMSIIRTNATARPLSPQATTAAISILKNIPKDIWDRIFSYDSTYHDLYQNRVLYELEWHALIYKRIQFNRIVSRDLTRGLFDVHSNIKDEMIRNMIGILPTLTSLGFRANTFEQGQSMWYNEDHYYKAHNQHTKGAFCHGQTQGLTWKTCITVSMKVNHAKLTKRAKQIANQRSPVPFMTCTLLDTDQCKITTSNKWNYVMITFYDVTIPLDDVLMDIEFDEHDMFM